MKWQQVTELDSGIAHIYPPVGKAHDTDRDAGCWCKPTRKPVEGGVIWVHHNRKATA